MMARSVVSLVAVLLYILTTGVSAFSQPISIKVEPGWGDARAVDVQTVLDSVADVMWVYTGGRTLDHILVRNDESGPVSLYERGEQGEYIVLLNIQGRYWSQLVYQFAHETCHLLSNYDLAPNNITHQQWFEESLCEAFSLFTLERMAERWSSDAPYASWASYAPELQKYADTMMQQKHRNLSADLSDWYRLQKATLEANPYAQERMLNEKVATHLLKLFAKQPDQWAAINYLNLGEDNGDKSFSKYLNDWYANTPEQYRTIVVEIQQQLGVGQFSKNLTN